MKKIISAISLVIKINNLQPKPLLIENLKGILINE